MKTEYTAKELTALADKHLVHNYGYPPDVVFREGNGCMLYDIDGKGYLDFMSCYSALNVGSGHPTIMRAAKDQLATGLTTLPRTFLQEELVLFVKELAEFTEMEMVLPMNSGTEGVETAMKIARKWGYVKKDIPEDKAEIIFCANNFHGRSISVISASTTPQYQKHFGPLLPGIVIIPFGDTSAFRGAINKNTAAIIVEPIQAEGGIILPPDGYLADLRKICDKEKVLFIADEVQTGFARTGHMFGCDYDSVKPDLYVLGKALGGGFPISAVVGMREVMDVIGPGDHGSTFGGNPFSCHVARAALRVIKDEGLDKKALNLGAYFQAGLIAISEKHPGVIKDIRGRGLLIGVEMNEKGPKAKDLCVELMKKGLLTKETRDYVLRFSPALVITKKELKEGLRIIESVFAEIDIED